MIATHNVKVNGKWYPAGSEIPEAEKPKEEKKPAKAETPAEVKKQEEKPKAAQTRRRTAAK